MTTPDVSIIIPVYNVEKYLERCVNSLRCQTLENIEIILVDDSSKDSSPKICDDFAAADPRIRVIHKENGGAGMARNAALEVAKGRYIGFVDSDDYVEKEMFETLLGVAEKYGSDLVMSGFFFKDGAIFGDDGASIRKEYFDCDTHFESDIELRHLKMGIVGALPSDEDDSKYGMSIWKNLFRAEIIRENNLLFRSERELLSEDALFMIDFISCIKKATGINGAFYNYCRNEDSISKSYKKDRFQKSLVFVGEVERIFKKDSAEEEYGLYIYRFWQAMCRVLCSQEIMHAADNRTGYSQLRERLKEICTHPISKRAFSKYPLGSLPIKQRIFAYAMKHKLYYVLKSLVELRR